MVLAGGFYSGKRDRYKSHGIIGDKSGLLLCRVAFLAGGTRAFSGVCHGVSVGMTSEIARGAEHRTRVDRCTAHRIDGRETGGNRGSDLNCEGSRPNRAV